MTLSEIAAHVNIVYRFMSDCQGKADLIRVDTSGRRVRLGKLSYYYTGAMREVYRSGVADVIVQRHSRLSRVVTVYRESGMVDVDGSDLHYKEAGHQLNRAVDGVRSIVYEHEVKYLSGYGYQVLMDYTKYIDGLLKRYSTLAVWRIDLKYRTESVADLETVQHDLRLWLKGKHAGRGWSDTVGYIWRLERGDQLERWHVHCLILTLLSVTSIESLGRLWREVTSDRGVAYITEPKGKIDLIDGEYGTGYPCTGVIDGSDHIAKVGLTHVLMYFLKDYKCVHTDKKARCIGRGQLPTERQSDVADV